MAKRTTTTTTQVDGDGQVAGEMRASIPAPNYIVATFRIRGDSAYVQNKFSTKAREQMRLTQEAGSQSKKGKKREPKDFQGLYEACQHKATGGGWGIPAPAFRNALIDACRVVGFKMTHAKEMVFILANCQDADDFTPLVRITKGEPHYFESPVRNDSGVVDLRPRAMWSAGWEADVPIRFNADYFNVRDTANLLMHAGISVGVGEGRPFSKDSAGQGWGTWEVLSGEGE